MSKRSSRKHTRHMKNLYKHHKEIWVHHRRKGSKSKRRRK